MKKSIRIMGMAALVMLLAISCKKEKQEGNKKITVKAGVESVAKPYVNFASPTNIYLCWEKDDAIMINGNELAMKELGPNYKEALFEGDWVGPEPDGIIELRGITPINRNHISKGHYPQKTNDQGNWVSLAEVPKKQIYINEGNRRFMNDFPMGVYNTTIDNLQFASLVSAFCINVYNSTGNSIKISKVVMSKDESGDDRLSLAGLIYHPHVGDDSWKPDYLEIINDENKSDNIELTCPNIEVSNSYDNPTAFYFVAWPVQFANGVRFDFYDDEEKCIATINKALNSYTTQEGRIYTLCENPDDNSNPAKPYDLKEHMLLP